MPTARTQNFGMGLKEHNSFKGNSANRGKAKGENQNRQKRLVAMNIRDTKRVSAVPVKKKFTDAKKGAADLDPDARFYPKSTVRAFQRGNYRRNNK